MTTDKISDTTREMLTEYAAKYETADFLHGDPSWFMHQVSGATNQEAMAFVASALSYGNRKQFMPRIEWLMNKANGRMHEWILTRSFDKELPKESQKCFYRLYTVRQLNDFLSAYHHVLSEHGSLKNFVANNATDGLSAVAAICRAFGNAGTVVPKDTSSACKRVCMFMRWMVRYNSPVDLGLWADIIDRRTLIMPMDTHVMQQSCRLGLLSSHTTSMSSAKKLTQNVASIFPDDPLKADFALFGYGINNKTANTNTDNE